MESNNGYIYIRSHTYYEFDNICKLGRTKNIQCRDFTYATGEYKRGYFKLVIELLSHDDIFVEKLLKRYFKNYHQQMDGGSEFYSIQIIDEIIPFLSSTMIRFKILSQSDINNMVRLEHIIRLQRLLRKLINKKQYSENLLLNRLQEKYLNELTQHLLTNNKVFLKAPTGFGKTHIYYKTICKMKLNRILFLTPRRELNKQLVENKYLSYIINDNYEIIHFSHLQSTHAKEAKIKSYTNSNSNIKIIMTCCYQSWNNLYKLLIKYKLLFDLIIYDEAHFITSWGNNDILTNNNICRYSLFGSATPTEDIEIQPLIYGKIIEKVKIYELINNKILTNIETIIKQLNDSRAEYHNLKDLIINSMIKYSKRKGIIYVNNCTNAENLYRLLQKQNKINVYIYISKNIDVENDSDTDIKIFENDKNQCVIISVGMISYGYDNPFIDLIILGDPRQSDIDIRQIIGRGLRWNKSLYPNKILHLLIPLYKDEFNNYKKNEHLKKYLDYIIGECGNDLIIKADGTNYISNNSTDNNIGDSYDGDNIPTEILNDYCTTGYNKYTDFIKFLKANKLYDEITYNLFRENQEWMITLGEIQTKYPKFCFRNIHPSNMYYYWLKSEAIEAFNISNNILMNEMCRDRYRRLDLQDKLNKLNELDTRIPNINFDLYYPKD